MRGLAIVVVPFLLWGCRLNVFGQGPAEDSSSSGEPEASTGTSTTTTDGSTTAVASGTGSGTTTTDGPSSSSSSSSEGSSSTTGTVLACGESLDPPGGDGCEAPCTDCGEDGECIIECMGMEECLGAMLMCPADRPCSVFCGGPSACRDVRVECPPEHDCNVRCAGENTCTGMVITCAGGPCRLDCNTFNTSCISMEMHCGTNDSAIHCNQEQMGNKPAPIGLPDSTCECSVDEGC